MIIFFIENIFLNYVVFFLNHKGSIKFFFQLINPSNLWMFLLSSLYDVMMRPLLQNWPLVNKTKPIYDLHVSILITVIILK
jgi:hypothetical protein